MIGNTIMVVACFPWLAFCWWVIPHFMGKAVAKSIADREGWT